MPVKKLIPDFDPKAFNVPKIKKDGIDFFLFNNLLILQGQG